MRIKFIITLIALSILLQRCAKQSSPTGGPQDEIPPTLISSNPVNEQTDFKKSILELTFDEYIQLNNPREQLIITPTIGKKFEVTSKKNKVTVDLKATLQENTTYNINFREAIADLTEKNPVVIKLAFSTGSYIDSLSITGTVKEILTDKEGVNYTVALCEASDTFNLYKHQPSWITLTDKEGKFSLENLKPGKYFLYAFDDKNRNLIADSKSERYGFISEYISLDSTMESVTIPVYKLDASPLKLITTRPTFSYFLIRLSKALTTYELTVPDESEKLYSKLEPDNASIKVYNTIHTQDSLQIKLFAQDSLNNKIDTLIYLKFNKKEFTKDKFDSKIESKNYFENKSLLSSTVTFSKPVQFFNKDSIYIQLDSATLVTFSDQDIQWNNSKTKLELSKKIEVKKPSKTSQTGGPIKQRGKESDKESEKPAIVYNQITFPKGTFISVELDTAARMAEAIKTTTAEQSAVILAKVESKENFDKNFTLVDEIKNVNTHSFENLPPGSYLLRLIIDLNKNGKWDATSGQSERKDPEPVIFYRTPKMVKDIYLKANFEVGPLLITYQ